MPKNNLQAIRERAGLTREQVADRMDTTSTTIYRKEVGDRGLKHAEIIAFAEALGCKPEEIVSNQQLNRVPVIANVGAGAKIFPIDDLPLMRNGLKLKEEAYANCDMVDAPPGVSPSDVVAVRIKGDSMMPFMPEGTIAYYEQRIEGDCSALFNRLSIVQIRNGAALLKILKRGPQVGRYNLMSYNSDVIEDVDIEWAARVSFVHLPK